MRKTLLVLGLLLEASLVQAQATWSTEVAPIIYNKCASCHRSGGIAPFPLITYQDAVNNSGSINTQAQNRTMPPWPPDPTFNRLAHERLLSQDEIDKIADWATHGTPQGNISLAPPPPTFSTTGDLPGTPNLISKIPKYTSTANTGDVYQCFVIPSGQTADKYVTALEALPGNRGIVHHVLIYADTTGTCAALDAATPGPGYLNFGGVGTNDAILMGAWVPGSAPMQYPSGFGVRLPKNADIVLQIHYPSGTAGQLDTTEVHLFFSSTSTGIRNLSIDPVLNYISNISPALNIPANTTKSFTEHFQVPFFNMSIFGIFPHMHLLGKTIDCFGVTPAKDTQKYIRINAWDFHWQGFYMFRNVIKVPANTNLYSNAFYDNTTGNPENPNNPPKDVHAGESTTDEMMLNYFIYTAYQPGDENIVIDNSPLVNLGVGNYYKTDQLFSLVPNPANSQVIIKYYIEHTTTGKLDIIDMQGRIVRQLFNGEMKQNYYANTYSISELPAGMYTVRLSTADHVVNQKLLIER